MKTFKSDNTASVHPLVMQKIMEVNTGHADPYGYDTVCAEAEQAIREAFGAECHVCFVTTGTGANVIGLSTLIKPFEGVICADSAHINADECGAFERYTGAKLLTVPHVHGKVTVEAVREHLKARGNEHHSQPRVISISQLTEWGTAYSISEIKALADFAHDNDLLLHMDGARLANALVAQNSSFREMITDTGVDVLSFGGAKNGTLYGEAIVSFHPATAKDLKFSRKQGMQLMSKMRFIAAQYLAVLEKDLWKTNAGNANDRMAQLYAGIRDIEEIDFAEETQGNMMFPVLPLRWIEALLEKHHFYPMTEEGDRGMVRLVTSFDTTEEEVTAFVEDLQQLSHEACS